MDLVLASGVAAGVAGVLAHFADVFTCFSGRAVLDGVLEVPDDILDLDKASLMMAEKTVFELAVGQVLALVFIPAGFVGSYFLFNVIRPEYSRLRWPLVLMLFAFYSLGASMHCSFTFVGLMSAQPGFRGSALAEQVRPFFEVLCGIVGRRLMLPGNLVVFALLASKCTILPRWTCLFCPGALQLAVAMLAGYAPLGLRVYLLATIYNMSSGIWWLAMSGAYLRIGAREKVPKARGALQSRSAGGLLGRLHAQKKA